MNRPDPRQGKADGASRATTHQPGASPVTGYEELAEIGRGASGRVYRARQVRMNRQVALKVLDAAPDDRDARRRFDRELEITVRLGSHPHIVQVLDAGQATDGRPYLAMELFERGSAGDWLARYGTFAEADAVRAGAAIADALAAAHHAGVLHRDVKPENILLSGFGPALSDFGIARPADQLDRTSSFSQFTPWHAAPEVLLDHPPTEAADVYSLASTLFTLLDGRPPFAGPPGETLLAFQRRVLTEAPRALPADIDPGLAEVILAALARQPEQRTATAAALRDQLRLLGSTGFTAGEAGRTGAPPDGPPPPAEAGPAGGDGAFDPGATLPPPRPTPSPIAPGPDLGATAPRARAIAAGAGADPPTSAAAPLAPPAPAPGPLGDRGDLALTRAAGTTPDPVEERSGDATRRARWPLVVGGVVGLLLVAALVGAWWPRDATDVPTTTTAIPVIPTVPKGSPGTPEDVKVRDQGNKATITWTDTTKGAGTPGVVVLDEEGTKKATTLDDGQTTFVAEGLDPSLGYCFVVTVFFPGADGGGITNASSEPACIRGAEIEATTTTAAKRTTTTTR